MSGYDPAVCDICGTTIEDFERSGYLGCSRCYDVFRGRVLNALSDTQRTIKHVGRGSSASRVSGRDFREPLGDFDAGGVVVSSRVRLARNFREIPFPHRMTDERDARLVTDAAVAAARFPRDVLFMRDLAAAQRGALVEKHFVSPDFAGNGNGALILSEDRNVSVMINEEDHVRAQCIMSGFRLRECCDTITAYDDALSSEMPVAYDSSFGFLTACITNAGTGMRASVMVFLPAVTLTGKVDLARTLASDRGLTVRGVYGEGSGSKGCLYQLSNIRSMGLDEETILRRVTDAAGNLCALERNFRKQMYEDDEWGLKDRVTRACGILSNATVLSSDEFMELVSYVKLGYYMRIITLERPELLDELVIEAQPANLSVLTGIADADAGRRDLLRAEIVGKVMKKLNPGRI